MIKDFKDFMMPSPIVTGHTLNNGRTYAKREKLTDILKDWLEVRADDDEGIKYKVKIVRRLLDLALEGNLEALKYIFDRVDGKPKQAIELQENVIISKGYTVISPDDWDAAPDPITVEISPQASIQAGKVPGAAPGPRGPGATWPR